MKQRREGHFRKPTAPHAELESILGQSKSQSAAITWTHPKRRTQNESCSIRAPEMSKNTILYIYTEYPATLTHLVATDSASIGISYSSMAWALVCADNLKPPIPKPHLQGPDLFLSSQTLTRALWTGEPWLASIWFRQLTRCAY